MSLSSPILTSSTFLAFPRTSAFRSLTLESIFPPVAPGEFFHVAAAHALDRHYAFLAEEVQYHVVDAFLAEKHVSASFGYGVSHLFEHPFLFVQEELHLVWA